MSAGAEPIATPRELKPKDQAAHLGKEADETKEETENNSANEEPGEASHGQRIIEFSEVKKKEAAKDPQKKVREGQVEIS